jgi:hypothetical protein
VPESILVGAFLRSLINSSMGDRHLARDYWLLQVLSRLRESPSFHSPPHFCCRLCPLRGRIVIDAPQLMCSCTALARGTKLLHGSRRRDERSYTHSNHTGNSTLPSRPKKPGSLHPQMRTIPTSIRSWTLAGLSCSMSHLAYRGAEVLGKLWSCLACRPAR